MINNNIINREIERKKNINEVFTKSMYITILLLSRYIK